MTGLEKWEHGNPETVAIRREAMTCKGCVRLESVVLFGQRTEYCVLGRPDGKRCKRYKESGEK